MFVCFHSPRLKDTLYNESLHVLFTTAFKSPFKQMQKNIYGNSYLKKKAVTFSLDKSKTTKKSNNKKHQHHIQQASQVVKCMHIQESPETTNASKIVTARLISHFSFY